MDSDWNKVPSHIRLQWFADAAKKASESAQEIAESEDIFEHLDGHELEEIFNGFRKDITNLVEMQTRLGNLVGDSQ